LTELDLKELRVPFFFLVNFFLSSFTHCSHHIHTISVHQHKFQNSLLPPFNPHMVNGSEHLILAQLTSF
jgi:hypothetical protein